MLREGDRHSLITDIRSELLGRTRYSERRVTRARPRAVLPAGKPRLANGLRGASISIAFTFVM